MDTLPPDPAADQSPARPPTPDWPPSIADLVAGLDSPEVLRVTHERTGQQYDCMTGSLATSTGPAREFGLPAVTPLYGLVLRRTGAPHVVFELVGRLPTPDSGEDNVVSYTPRNGIGPAIELEVWRMRAYCRGLSVYGQVRWHLLAATTIGLEWVGAWPSPYALKVATTALHELCSMSPRRAGQKLLEDKPYHPWRETAQRAEELQQKHPTWSHLKIARELGMLGQAETLRRWRKRLSENG
jgi:hypothetical protein